MAGLIEKIRLVNEVLQRGKTVADPATLADRATWLGNLVALLSALAALASLFGYDLQLSEADIQGLAVGAGVAVSVGIKLVSLMHTAANPHAGRRLPDQPGRDD